MKAEYRDKPGCPQRDNAEHEGYAGAQSIGNREVNEQDGADLLERILSRENLNKAYKRVRANHGAPGIDGMTVEDALPWLREHREELLESIRLGKYKPQPVRRKEIPKPDGGVRKLGIPTVVDRIIQQAIAQQLVPIYEPLFSDLSYGYRPKRSAQQAIQKVKEYAEQGYTQAVLVDLSKYFDTLNHELLMNLLRKNVTDTRVIELIKRYLKAGVMENGLRVKTTEGSPQGGPLSPLLANVLLDDLDRELENRGLHFCRYADDCIILVRTIEAGERVLVNISRYIEEKLKLKVNQQKSKVDKVWNCVYLGYIIGVEGKLRIAPASVKKLKSKVRLITRRNRPTPLREVIAELTPIIRGWTNYFKLAAINKLCQELDEWTRRKLRCLRLKQCKHPKGIRRFLESIGVKRKMRKSIGSMGRRWWWISCSQLAHICMDNAWLRAEGYISFYQLLKR